MSDEYDRHQRIRPSRLEIATLMAVCLASLLLRCLDLNRSLWLDELHTSWSVSGSIEQIYPRAISGNQSPLYFYTVWFITSLLGHTEISLRLTSVAAGTCLAFTSWFLARKMTGSGGVGLLAATLIGCDPFFVEYSQEARPYALLQLIGLFQIYFFGKRMQQVSGAREVPVIDGNGHNPENRKARTGFILFSVAGFYIHFTAILLTVSMLLLAVGWFVLGFQKFGRRHAGLLFDFFVVFLACLPLLPIVLTISQRKSNWELFVNDTFYNDSIVFQCLTYILPGLLAIAAAFLGDRRSGKSALKPFLYAGCFFLPIILSWISLKMGVAALYHPRYSLIGWAGAVLFCSTGIGFARSCHPEMVRKFTLLVGLAVVGFALFQNHLLWHVVSRQELSMPFESPWRDSIKHIETVQTKKLVYLFSNLIEDRFLGESTRLNPEQLQKLEEYCSFPLRGLYQVSAGDIVPRSTLFRPRFNSSDRKTILEFRRVVLIIRGNQQITSDILNEFATFGLKRKIFIKQISRDIFPVRGAPGNFIGVFEFEATAE